MTKKEKIIFILFFSIIIVVVSMSFYKFVILNDFFVSNEEDCDLQVEKCLVRDCEPDADEGCVNVNGESVKYYKEINKKAYDMVE
jgi:hypothetical protein